MGTLTADWQSNVAPQLDWSRLKFGVQQYRVEPFVSLSISSTMRVLISLIICIGVLYVLDAYFFNGMYFGVVSLMLSNILHGR